MKPLSVTGLGTFTPVGMTVPQTMGSLLLRLQWFDDLELIGATGEPVTGARVSLSNVENTTERYVGMGRFALAECRERGNSAGASGEPVPLFLATSHERDLPCASEQLLARILDGDEEMAEPGSAGAVDRRTSRVFAEGKGGTLRALAAAQQLIASGHARACYVGGVDSLMDPVRLNELLEDGRLLDGGGTDGFIPGEGAVFLRLEGRPPREGGGVILAAALTDQPASAAAAAGASAPASAASSSALARAAREALRLSGISASSLSALVHDGSSAQATVEEIAMTISRLPFDNPTPLASWAPAFSVGETGAAAALLTIAMTTFFLQEKVFAGPALLLLMSETSKRAALVMGLNEPREGRRG